MFSLKFHKCYMYSINQFLCVSALEMLSKHSRLQRWNYFHVSLLVITHVVSSEITVYAQDEFMNWCILYMNGYLLGVCTVLYGWALLFWWWCSCSHVSDQQCLLLFLISIYLFFYPFYGFLPINEIVGDFLTS